jgi:hypothetical protein
MFSGSQQLFEGDPQNRLKYNSGAQLVPKYRNTIILVLMTQN